MTNLKKNNHNWIKRLIKPLKLIYFLIFLDFNSLDFDLSNYSNNFSTEEKIIIAIIAFICTGIFVWTVTHDEDFEKKLKDIDASNDKWKKPWSK